MNEEITNIVVDEQQNESGTTGDANSYIEAIKEMRKNSVSKADYERLQAENKELMKALVNGETITLEPQEDVDVNALIKELYVDALDMSNLEYVEKTLKLRDAIIEEGGDDPFVGAGHKFAPSAEDYEAAERVANVFRECIDYADGDSALFTQELMRRTIDINPVRKPQKNNNRR